MTLATATRLAADRLHCWAMPRVVVGASPFVGPSGIYREVPPHEATIVGSVDAAFVLVVAKRADQPVGGIRFAPSSDDLGFVARYRHDWSGSSGTVMLTMWQRAAGDDTAPRAWWRDGEAVSFVAGHLLLRDAAADPARWSEYLAHLASRMSAREVQVELRGIFAAVHLDQHGDGWVLTDPFGLRCLYVAENDDVLVISSRAPLAARSVTAQGQAPARDARGACWLAFTGYRVGYSSGYRDVRLAAPGALLCLRHGRASWEARPFLVGEGNGADQTVEAMAERVIDDVASSLRAVLRQERGEPVVRLTGGKDSRLVLAIALHAEIADRFRYETVGFPGLADADVASELAERLALRHELRFVGLRPKVPYADRARGFVTATGCMTNAWTIDAPTGANHVSVTGICGEALRSFAKLPAAVPPATAVEQALRRERFNRLGLIRTAVAEHLYAELMGLVADEPTARSDPFVRYHAHFLGHRLRLSRVGPREEIGGDRRVQPLYSHVTIGAAMALPPLDRQSEVLFAEIMRQSSSILVEHRFAGPGWDARAQAHLGMEAPVARPAGPGPAAPAASLAKPPSLMATIQADPSDERTDLLTEVFADASNPAWDVIDRERARAAVQRYAALTTPERTELFGAATAAIWLGSLG